MTTVPSPSLSPPRHPTSPPRLPTSPLPLSLQHWRFSPLSLHLSTCPLLSLLPSFSSPPAGSSPLPLPSPLYILLFHVPQLPFPPSCMFLSSLPPLSPLSLHYRHNSPSLPLTSLHLPFVVPFLLLPHYLFSLICYPFYAPEPPFSSSSFRQSNFLFFSPFLSFPFLSFLTHMQH